MDGFVLSVLEGRDLGSFDGTGYGVGGPCVGLGVVVSGLQAVCHVRIMRRWSSNLEQWTIQRPSVYPPGF